MRYKPRIDRAVPGPAGKDDGRDHPKHRAWIRTLKCLVHGPDCRGVLDPHHVRLGTDGGMGLRPHDKWCVPLCRHHHDLGDRIGWRSFERLHNVNLRSEALRLAECSPDRGVRNES
jgi:hypothetical protein